MDTPHLQVSFMPTFGRRQWLLESAMAAGGVTLGAVRALAASDDGISRTAEAIHQEVVFRATPKRVYDALTELVPNERIVQAWRTTNWTPGLYSIARFELAEQGSSTKLVFDHTGFPSGTAEHLAAGWKANYWEPLEKLLG